MVKEALEVWQFLSDKWDVIISSPLRVSIITVVIIGPILYWTFNWKFEAIIKNKDQDIVTRDAVIRQKEYTIEDITKSKDSVIQSRDSVIIELEKRLLGKEEQLNVYRLKLNEIAATGTAYTLMTNDDLKRQTRVLIVNIRAFESQRRLEEQNNWNAKSRNLMNVKSEEEKTKILDKGFEEENIYHYKYRYEYKQKFHSKSVLLRDELLSRLPKEIIEKRKARGKEQSYFDWVYNGARIEEVADDLEQLALSLPDTSQYQEEQ